MMPSSDFVNGIWVSTRRVEPSTDFCKRDTPWCLWAGLGGLRDAISLLGINHQTCNITTKTSDHLSTGNPCSIWNTRNPWLGYEWKLMEATDSPIFRYTFMLCLVCSILAAIECTLLPCTLASMYQNECGIYRDFDIHKEPYYLFPRSLRWWKCLCWIYETDWIQECIDSMERHKKQSKHLLVTPRWYRCRICMKLKHANRESCVWLHVF